MTETVNRTRMAHDGAGYRLLAERLARDRRGAYRGDMAQVDVDPIDTALVDASREVAARLRDVAERLEQLPPPAAADLLAALGDPARLFLRTAERLIARAAWTAATR
jgi:hypothetical protein